MFTVEFRDVVRDKIVSKAKSDTRITAAAVIGSYAQGTVDKWSDIDLTFGVHDNYSIDSLIDFWTDYISKEFAGVLLFDVQAGKTTYRVFLLPGCLQIDLSFSPSSEFGPTGPYFTLLYSNQNVILKQQKTYQAQPVQETFGYIIHHILRARFCAERGKFWQAEFWINESRNEALKIACASRGLNGNYARDFDNLPKEVLACFLHSFIGTPNKAEILRALEVIIVGLPFVSDEVKILCKGFTQFFNEILSVEES